MDNNLQKYTTPWHVVKMYITYKPFIGVIHYLYNILKLQTYQHKIKAKHTNSR